MLLTNKDLSKPHFCGLAGRYYGVCPVCNERDVQAFESWQREEHLAQEAAEIAAYEGWRTEAEMHDEMAAMYEAERRAENAWLVAAEYDEENQWQMEYDDMRGAL